MAAPSSGLDRSILCVAVVSASITHTAAAAFTTPADWVRPTDAASAQAGLTTYHEWQRFVSPVGPNTPNDGITGDTAATFALDGLWHINPNTGVTPDVYDTSGGSFVTSSGSIYSPMTPIRPVAEIGSYGLTTGVTYFVVQLRTLGADVVTRDTDTSVALALNGTSVQALDGYSYTELFRQPLGGFGGAIVDHRWTFAAPDDAAFTLAWDVGNSSVSLDAIVIDTRTLTPGDVDRDGDSDFDDLGLLLGAYATSPQPGTLAAQADFDLDGVIDFDDLGILLGVYGTGASAQGLPAPVGPVLGGPLPGGPVLSGPVLSGSALSVPVLSRPAAAAEVLRLGAPTAIPETHLTWAAFAVLGLLVRRRSEEAA